MTPLPRVALALVLAAYLVPLAVPAPLMEDDEGLHAAIAQEMVERGDWTVPRLLGEPFLDKPILYFWLQAVSIAAFGPSEFSVRLPGTLVALAGIAATAWLAGLLLGPGAGVWAGVCYATMLLPYAISLAPLHDLVMVPFVAIAVGAFWRARHAANGGELLRWTGLAGVALGLSILGKGLTGVGLVGVGVATWLLWTRALTPRLIAAGLAAVALAVALAWPWYAAMERAVPGYLDYYLMDRHLAGVTQDTQRHAGRPLLYYLPILLVGAWPWIVFVRQPLARGLRDGERLLWAWLLADVVLLSLAGSKLATYVLPALPALAALCAVGLFDQTSTAGVRGRQMLARGTALLTAALPLAGLVVLNLDGRWATPQAATYVWAAVPLVLAGAVLWGRQWDGPATLAAVAALTLTAAAAVIRPVVAGRLTAEGLSAHFNAIGEMPPSLLVVDEGVGSFLFYLRPDLRRPLSAARVARVSRFSLGDVPDHRGVVVAIAADRVAGVTELYDVGLVPELRDGTFLVRPREEFRARPAVR